MMGAMTKQYCTLKYFIGNKIYQLNFKTTISNQYEYINLRQWTQGIILNVILSRELQINQLCKKFNMSSVQ